VWVWLLFNWLKILLKFILKTEGASS
jgi:hypothetical protein